MVVYSEHDRDFQLRGPLLGQRCIVHNVQFSYNLKKQYRIKHGSWYPSTARFMLLVNCDGSNRTVPELVKNFAQSVSKSKMFFLLTKYIAIFNFCKQMLSRI